MTRIYENRPLARRMNISVVVTIFAILFGFWEAWNAFNAGPEGAGYGFLFAALFIGGGIYGMNQVLTDSRDMVTALDIDEANGHAAISVWRPFGATRIEGPLDRLTEWRPWAKEVRRVRTPVLLADHPGHPRPLQFEVGPGIALTDQFRALAPEALASFERTPESQSSQS
jgi:hypothetical protein